MRLLQATIPESHIWPASSKQSPRSVERQQAPGRINAPIQKLPRFCEAMDSNPAAEERRLIQRALAGDPDALSPLFARYSPRLSRTAFSLLRNKEDAEDALQDGLLSAYLHLDSFQGRSRFSTWLTRIVVNAALMALRRKRARPKTSLDESQNDQSDDWPTWIVDSRPNPEQTCAARETRQIIQKHVDQLSAGVRSAFCLREIEGFSTKETREILGIQANAVKSRLLRARSQLTRLLQGSLRIPDGKGITEIPQCDRS